MALSPPRRAAASLPPLPQVVFEDDDLIAFDKPSGLLAVPDRWDAALVNLMQLVHDRLDPQWANVHRLDRETSGVMLLAKHSSALRHVSEQFEFQQVRKTYLALVQPSPADEHGTIDAPLVDDERKPGRMRVAAHGKPSQTDYGVLERLRPAFGWVELHPRTGRTHQLRVHLALLGCPIVADALYGSGTSVLLSDLKRNYKPTGDQERPLLDRLALHAASLTLTHPTSGKPLTISAPLPKDLQVLLKQLRKIR